MPTITSISPTQGHSGTVLTITGTGLGSSPTTTKVNFGATAITPATVTSTSVTLTAPAVCSGQVNVSVTASGVVSNTKPFFFIGTPECSFVSPGVGPAGGATAVTVTGTGLATATGVTFDAEAPVAPTSVVGDSQLTATTPAHTVAGDTETVNVIITTAGGNSVPNGGATQFTYYNAPTVTAVSPDTGPAGQTGIAVTGTAFVDVSAVNFRDEAAPNTVFPVDPDSIVGLSPTLLTVTAPAGLVATNVYEVRVTTPGGQSALNPTADEYTATD
jgi:hypothetical protein